MRIKNNIMALNTHRRYGLNNAAVAKNTEKLSSGYHINRAGDDAAGLAISEKMRAQIRGLNMASKNSQDAVSLVQTAEGALQETHNILQRMRELSVQAASDTNEQTIDRHALDMEYQALKAEINDVAHTTRFNDQNLIDGTFQKAHYSVDNTFSQLSPQTTADVSRIGVKSGYNAGGIYNIGVQYIDGQDAQSAGSHGVVLSGGTYEADPTRYVVSIDDFSKTGLKDFVMDTGSINTTGSLRFTSGSLRLTASGAIEGSPSVSIDGGEKCNWTA